MAMVQADLDTLFAAGPSVLKKVARISEKDSLMIYAHYKQAAVGRPTMKRPPAHNRIDRKKYDAWVCVASLSADDAKQGYCKIVDRVKPGWRAKVEASLATTPVDELVPTRPSLHRAATDTALPPTLLESPVAAISSKQQTKKVGNNAVPSTVAISEPSVVRRSATSALASSTGDLISSTPLVAPQASKPVVAVDDVRPGRYLLVTKVLLTEAKEVHSRDIVWMSTGSKVDILEVVRDDKAQRIRGRVEDPKGWISIIALDNGQRWASPVADPAPAPVSAEAPVSVEVPVQLDASRVDQPQPLQPQSRVVGLAVMAAVLVLVRRPRFGGIAALAVVLAGLLRQATQKPSLKR